MLAVASAGVRIVGEPENVGRNKLAQFRQPYGKRTAEMPERRKLVPAYGPLALGVLAKNRVKWQNVSVAT